MKKLTLISIVVNNHYFNDFLMLPIVDGKAKLPHSTLNALYRERTGKDIQDYSQYSIG